MSVVFSISSWCGWVQQISEIQAVDSPSVKSSETPDIRSIPSMLRRRLNLLGRAAASQILTLLEKGDNIPMVYCSRHGDIERTLSVLKELTTETPVSPTNFGLSVHNAVPGVISIHSKLTAAISSIAAGEEGLIPALLEAAGILSPRCCRVICVICDVVLPEIYRLQGYGPDQTFAACFMLTLDTGTPLLLENIGPAQDDNVINENQIPSPLLLVEFLDNNCQKMYTPHNGNYWRITRL